MKFESKERILVSIANVPGPSIKVIRLLAGIIPSRTIWEFSAATAGERDAYHKFVEVLREQTGTQSPHSLDAIIKKLLPCRSCREAVTALSQAEAEALRNA